MISYKIFPKKGVYNFEKCKINRCGCPCGYWNIVRGVAVWRLDDLASDKIRFLLWKRKLGGCFRRCRNGKMENIPDIIYAVVSIMAIMKLKNEIN